MVLDNSVNKKNFSPIIIHPIIKFSFTIPNYICGLSLSNAHLSIYIIFYWHYTISKFAMLGPNKFGTRAAIVSTI
jgi:hypothetical protein